MNRPLQPYATWTLFGLALFCAGVGLAQGAISVTAGVSEDNVVPGEQFIYQITVDGTNDVRPPDLAAATADLDIKFQKSFAENAQINTNINGRTSRVIRRIQRLNYIVRARKPGNIVIPEVEVIAGGETFRTEAIDIRVREEESNGDLQFTTELSKYTAYVGEALQLTTVLYFSKSIDNGLSLDIPLLASDAFEIQPVPASPNIGRLALYGKEVEVQQSRATRQGRNFTKLVFSHIVIPKSPGRLEFPSATATVPVATGRRIRSNSFFGGTRAEYESAFVKAQPIMLDVKPVPDEGKPDDYSGLVGAFAISAAATPTEVKIGDPISLTITLAGSPQLQTYELPDLDQWPALAKNFRTHEESSPGRMDGEKKVFVQTIRANSDAVTEIPPITLSYFNAASGTYAVAASRPIPLKVVEAPTVTAADAEGFRAAPDTVDHIAVNEGIAHNFTGAAALESQRFGPDVWLRATSSWLLLLLPPFLYAVLAGSLFVRERGGLFVMDRRQARALPVLEGAIDGLDTTGDVYGPVFDALRIYLGTRLERQPSALTYADVEPLLRKRGVGDTILADLKGLFEACESHRYAGATEAPADNEDFVARAKQCARTLNQELER